MKDIKNPLKTNVLLSLLVALFGGLLALIPALFLDTGIYQFYFNYFGCLFGAGGLIFAGMYAMRIGRFTRFAARDEGADRIRWDYDDAYYESYVNELNRLQRKMSYKRFGIMILVVIAIAVILYFLMGDDVRYLGLFIMVFVVVLALIMMMVVPLITRQKELVRPYRTIIDEDGAYILGRFHSWEKAEARVREYHDDHGTYRVLAINYESFGITGKNYREWDALIPDQNNPEYLKEAKLMANRINKRSKHVKPKEKQGDPLDRLFEKMLAKNEDDPKK